MHVFACVCACVCNLGTMVVSHSIANDAVCVLCVRVRAHECFVCVIVCVCVVFDHVRLRIHVCLCE